MPLSEPGKRTALLLAMLFVAAMVTGYVVFAIYSTLSGNGVPPLHGLGVVLAVLGLLVLAGGAIYRRR